MRQCAICDKLPVIGSVVTHRGMLKKQGGVGRRTVRVNRRRFLPNIQKVTMIKHGTVRRVWACTACLRSGRVQKAPSHPARRSS